MAQGSEDPRDLVEVTTGDGAPTNDEAVKRPVVADVSDARTDEEEAKILRNAWPPFSAYMFDFLRSGQGTKVVENITALAQSVKQTTLGRRAEEEKRAHTRYLVNQIARYALGAGIVGCAVALRVYDKLDEVMIGLFAGALGFLFGQARKME